MTDARQISILNAAATKDEYGQVGGSQSVRALVWAEVKFVAGKVAQMAGKETTEVEIEFKIRYRSDVSKLMSVLHENQIYKIDLIEEIGRRAFLRLKCRRVS